MNNNKSKRRIIQVLMTILIVVLPFINIVRIDVPTKRFYFFNTVLWVDELYLIFLVVILFSLIVLFFTLIYGRLWCGWACPQTTMSDLARWLDGIISRKIHRRKLPAASQLTWIIKSIILLVISLFISLNIVIYFVDPYRLFSEISTWSQGPIVTGFIIALTVLVFFNLSFVRELFCIRACPYGLLQFLFTDSLTQIVKFDKSRSNLCMKCDNCVRCCAMKIDIRNSPYQTECNYCGDCIDACAAAMKKRDLTSLINYSQGENEIQGGFVKKTGILRGKRLILIFIICLMSVGVVSTISFRSPISIIIIQDRYTLIRKGNDGLYYNDYQMKITNRSLEDGTFRFKCVNRANSKNMKVETTVKDIYLKSRETGTVQFSLASDGKGVRPGPNMIDCTAFNVNKVNVLKKAEIVFFWPDENNMRELNN